MTEVVIENLPDEFIVKHRHYHCEMEIEGYEIMNPEQFKKLQTALQSKGNVPLPNTPGHWDSDLPISDLVDAFQVISESQEEVDAFRKIFGCDSIGITDLSASVLETYIEELDEELNEIDLESLTELSEKTAIALANSETYYLSLEGLTELSDAAAESLSKHEGGLGLDGLKVISDAAAESLSRFQADLSLGGLTELSNLAAESFSKYDGYRLRLKGLNSLSDSAAKSLAKMDPEKLYISEELKEQISAYR